MVQMCSFVVLVSLALVFNVVLSQDTQTCTGENQEYGCAPCAVTCADQLAPPGACTADCKQGCHCKKDFALKGDKCVPLAECNLISSKYILYNP